MTRVHRVVELGFCLWPYSEGPNLVRGDSFALDMQKSGPLTLL